MKEIKKYVSNLDKDIYSISKLKEEKIAVVFAYVSRSPLSFRENLLKATELKTEEFHEKYVLQYGHSSVAEHAIIHLGIEKVSRLFSLELELSNKFLSFTEYSQRYQKPKRGAWYAKDEISNEYYSQLFDIYEKLIDKGMSKEDARYVLPLSMFTNLGMTGNALALSRSLNILEKSEHKEIRERAFDIKKEASKELPTLIRIRDYKKQNSILDSSYSQDIKEDVILLDIYDNKLFDKEYVFKVHMSEACFHQFIRHRAFEIKYTKPNLLLRKNLEKDIDDYQKYSPLFKKAIEYSKIKYDNNNFCDYDILNLNSRVVVFKTSQEGLDNFLRLRSNKNSQNEIKNIALKIKTLLL